MVHPGKEKPPQTHSETKKQGHHLTIFHVYFFNHTKSKKPWVLDN